MKTIIKNKLKQYSNCKSFTDDVNFYDYIGVFDRVDVIDDLEYILNIKINDELIDKNTTFISLVSIINACLREEKLKRILYV